MTVICTRCKKEMREVCPHCYVEGIRLDEGVAWRWLFCRERAYRLAAVRVVGLRLLFWKTRRNFFMCRSVCLNVLFMHGAGGTAQGICVDCCEKSRQIRASVAGSRAAAAVN